MQQREFHNISLQDRDTGESGYDDNNNDNNYGGTYAPAPGSSGTNYEGGGPQFVQRNKLTFEKKSTATLTRAQEEELQRRLHADGRPNMSQGFISKLFCPLNRANRHREEEFRPSPDASFCATSLIQLSHGITAYRLIEPCYVSDDKAEDLPVIICLHGMYDSSYIWGDCSDLLCDCERGPNCRVLVFDFYGRGRSPWTGIPCTLDVLVVQTKELLDCKRIESYFLRDS
jgi:pimeloyl-ACP methyl ester carboxylesterase